MHCYYSPKSYLRFYNPFFHVNFLLHALFKKNAQENVCGTDSNIAEIFR